MFHSIKGVQAMAGLINNNSILLVLCLHSCRGTVVVGFLFLFLRQIHLREEISSLERMHASLGSQLLLDIGEIILWVWVAAEWVSIQISNNWLLYSTASKSPVETAIQWEERMPMARILPVSGVRETRRAKISRHNIYHIKEMRWQLDNYFCYIKPLPRTPK